MEQSEKRELTAEQKLLLESQAIDTLLSLGTKIYVPIKYEYREPPKYIQWWNKKHPENPMQWQNRRIPKDWDIDTQELPNANGTKLEKRYVRIFHIKPLYLGTIDILRKLYIQIEYDEKTIDEQPFEETKKLFKYIPIMAQIVAVSVLNEKPGAGWEKKVGRLQEFFIDNLTVDKLKHMCQAINMMMNPGGFTSSIRLIRETSKSSNTMPKDGKTAQGIE